MSQADSTFYATIATIIPVLYLALAVEGHKYENALQTITQLIRSPDRHWLVDIIGVALIGFPVIVIAGFIVAAGAVGEVLAATALYQGHASPEAKRNVYIAVLILTAGVAIGPALTYLRFFNKAIRRASTAGDPETADPAATPDAEPGETGTLAADPGNTSGGQPRG